MDNQNINYQIQETYPKSKENLKTVSMLLRESWEIYFSKIKRLLGVLVAPFLVGLLMNFSKSFILSLISTILWLIAIPALIYIIKEDLGIKVSYQKAWKILVSYIWISFLVLLIVLGGFLLLIIPGIIFAVWYILSDYVLICEEKRGMSALSRSKQLVSGRWWEVFWRFFTINFLFFILLSPFFLPFFLEIISENTFNLIIPFFNFLIAPFYTIYGFLIYNNLKEIKKDVVE